jgi:hypothetical protein
MSKEVFLSNPTIKAILDYPEPSNLSLIEIIYNPEVLDVLSSIDHTISNFNKIPNAIYPDNINALKVMKKFTARSRHNCIYTKTLIGKGRYYKDTKVKKGDYASLQNCNGKVRRLIVDGKLVAIDMVNAHLEIIKNIASILNIPSKKIEILNQYCNNRNQILNDIMLVYDCDREKAKNYFITTLFGGSYDTWITHNNLLDKTDLKTDFMMKFEFAFDFIKNEINKLDVMNGLKALEKQVNKKKDWNINKSAFAIFLQEIESKVLIVMYQKLESLGCIIRIPIHDGIWFEDCNNIANPELLNELSLDIKNKLGLNIPLDYENTKPTDDDLKWYQNHKEFYDIYNEKKHEDKNFIEGSNDDAGASRIVISKFGDCIIRCNDTIMVKENHCWSLDTKVVKRVLSNMVEKSNIYFMGGRDKVFSYSNAVSHQKNCVIAICHSPLIKIDNDFITNIGANNKTYLPYLNGIWSFKDRKLYSYDELPNIHFLSIINLNLVEISKDEYDEFMNRVINPIFPIKIERDYFAHIISRSMAGHNEDKRWYGFSGLRDGGKGVLTDLMIYAFGKYFGTFDAGCLIKNDNNNEPARQLGWIVEHLITRGLWSNELPTGLKRIIVNGILIKMLVSGGDLISARKLHENILTFKPNFTMCCLFNHMPDVEPVDALENYLEICFKSKFVYAHELVDGAELYKLRDDNIKNDIKDDRYISAFTWWILNAYDDKIPTPDIIQKNSDAINKSEVKLSVDKFILKNFKNGTNKDRLHTSEISGILDDNGFSLSNKDIHRQFRICQIGEYKDEIRIDGIKKSGYVNIIYNKPIKNNEDLDD